MNENKIKLAIQLLKGKEVAADAVVALLESAIAPEPQFYKGQQVLCSNNGKDWTRHNILSIGLLDSFTYVKPDPKAASLPNWIEHDGSDGDGIEITITKKELLIVVHEDGQRGLFTSASSGMQLIDTTIIYAIIPLPQFIEQKE